MFAKKSTKRTGHWGWSSYKCLLKNINKRDYLPTMKSFIESQKKVRQWSHMCSHNGNCGFMRTYISCCIGSKDSSSRSLMFFKIGVLKIFASFTEEHLRWSLFLVKLQAWRPVALLKETPTQVLPCEICKI